MQILLEDMTACVHGIAHTHTHTRAHVHIQVTLAAPAICPLASSFLLTALLNHCCSGLMEKHAS